MPKIVLPGPSQVPKCGAIRSKAYEDDSIKELVFTTYRFTTVSMFSSGTHRAMRARCTHSANRTSVARVTTVSLPKAKLSLASCL